MKCKTQPAAPKDTMIAGQFDAMKTNTPCPRCGKTNPADIHTCTSKKDIEQWFIDQDQKANLNPKKPMDGDQVLAGFEATGFDSGNFKLRCFNDGVRWAEKYHGIGGKE